MENGKNQVHFLTYIFQYMHQCTTKTPNFSFFRLGSLPYSLGIHLKRVALKCFGFDFFPHQNIKTLYLKIKTLYLENQTLALKNQNLWFFKMYKF